MIVHEELKALLGTEAQDLALKGAPPHVILLVGVQGSGKTTTAAKLALHLKRKRLERSSPRRTSSVLRRSNSFSRSQRRSTFTSILGENAQKARLRSLRRL